WNRWAVEVRQEGKGRLHPVAHLTLRDLDWLDEQLAYLASNGVRLAMIAPALVDGKSLSHPDLDRAWTAFVDHGITPVFHVSAFHARFNGEPLTEMELKPSEYLMRHVRVAAFGYERPDILIRKAGDLFMFCSDFPHAEGMANPVVDYDAACGRVEGPAGDALYSGNLSWLLRR